MNNKMCNHLLEAILRLSKIEFYCDEISNDPIDYKVGLSKLNKVFNKECSGSLINLKMAKRKMGEAFEYIGAEPYWKQWLDDD
jgi:hypothetical protein